MTEEKKHNPLDNSRLLDIHRWSNFPQVIKAADELATELGFIDKRYNKCLRMVIIDLYQAWRVDPTQYLAFHRGENDYRGGTRYNKLRIKYDVLIGTIDALRREGYVEYHRGIQFLDESGNYHGHISRMKASRVLIRFIVSHLIKPHMISRHEGEELIVIRAKKEKKKVGKRTIKIVRNIEDKEETDAITNSRRILQDYNELLERTYIDVDDEHLTAEEQGKLRKYTLDLSRKRVHRVFNNDSWEEGGRFYGAWWMECPKLLRKFIVLNGEPTIELDYSGVHVHLMYALERINYAAKAEDAYTLEGYPHRDLNKYVFLIAVNAGGDDDCVDGVWKRLVVKRKLKEYGIWNKDQIRDVLLALKAKHEPIKDYIASSKGVKLQYIDSCIAEEIVEYFTKRNIPILTVHDSFIVTKLDEMLLLDRMHLAYMAEFKKYIPISFKSEMDEIRYDTGLIQIKRDNDPIIEVDRKELTSDRWHANRLNMKSYSQGRRELRWKLTGRASTMTKLTNIDYTKGVQ